MACDDNSTSSCRLLFVDTVFDAQTSFFVGVLENGGVLVIADTTEVDDAVWGKKILSTARGVLAAASCDQLCGVSVQEFFVDWDVLWRSEDGVVRFEVILCEECFNTIALGLDIW